MSDTAADYQVSIEVRLADADEARELEELLRSEGAQQVELREPGREVRGIAFIPIAVVAVIGVSALVDIYLRWRKNHLCQQIIDARKEGTPVITVNCEVKDGRIIVLLPEGKVEIHEVPDGVNLADLVKAALSGGVDALKAAAEKVQAKVVGPIPIDDNS